MAKKFDVNIGNLKDVIENKYVGESLTVGYTEKKKKRKVGEIFEEGGKRWIQKEGYKASYNENVESVRDLIKRKCNTCGKDIDLFGTRQDSIYYNKTGNCMDCQIEYENKLRINGTFKDYENKKVLSNQLSYLYELKVKIREHYEALKKETGIIKEYNYIQGAVVDEEVWTGGDPTEAIKTTVQDYKLLLKEIKNVKEKLRKFDGNEK